MNCHGGHGNYGSNEDENGHGKKGHKLHMLLMILCCALPVMSIIFLSFFKINNDDLRSILSSAAFLLCPLMHMLMIPMMFRKDQNGRKDQKI